MRLLPLLFLTAVAVAGCGVPSEIGNVSDINIQIDTTLNDTINVTF